MNNTLNSIINFPGDLKVLISAAATKPLKASEVYPFVLLLEDHAHKHPDDIAIICEDETLTWRTLNERANRVAHQLKTRGVKRGDCVSLFMQNRMEFVVCLLGINKLGAITGMINTNLTSAPLIHCINLIDSVKCIFGEELTNALLQVKSELNLRDEIDYLFVSDPSTTHQSTADQSIGKPDWAGKLDSGNSSFPGDNLSETQTVLAGDTAFYIFTSGTTGMPKAAVLSNKRILTIGGMSAKMLLRLKRTDRIYNCLPLYHGTGLMVGLAGAFTAGASSMIRRRFSVSAFWNDINEHRCTTFVYIGELIRYLMSKPPEHNDADNPVRTIIGNGLRPDIWMEFKNRFDIERIGEFYGASEGNGGFANVLNKNCTCGLGVAPVKLVAYDVANDEIINDSNGFCQEVEPGEIGLLLVEVTGTSEFEGYTDTDATHKKLLKSAFKEDDSYFNTGDLMKTVEVGFAFAQKHYQFVDRVGDTFRWKGENVSTNEVGEIINQSPDIEISAVYGVHLPGTDGRAGMAAIIVRDHAESTKDIDLTSLSAHIREHLASYARPLFLRVLKKMPTTATHKLQKNILKEEAFHPHKVTDELLVMKPGEQVYSRLDMETYDKIMNLEISF